MLIKTLTKFVLILTLCISAQAMAAFGDIVSQTEAVEADRIEVNWNKKQGTGFVSATGCTRCPLQLNFNEQIEILRNDKPVQLKNIKTYSGKPGTVVYDEKTKQAVKIIW